jgi:tRNA(Ile)-lysidine synthase
MIPQVLKTIKKYAMFSTGERVVVAVSGGPDSMALLHLLKEANALLCLDLIVAHLDHGLRKTSSQDRAFVKKTAQELNVPFVSQTLDPRKVKKSASLEDTLRRLRYAFLLKVAKKEHAQKIALAHHRDDQAETVLMRVLRGSGLYGLSAILPKRTQEGRVLVRPLLETSRKDILAYLKKNRIAFKIDATNSEDRFFRNKVRNQLLPFLEKHYNPNVKNVLSHLAFSVGADYSFLRKQADDFLKINLFCEGGVSRVSLKAFRELDIALRRMVLREMTERLGGDFVLGAFPHAEEVEDLIFSRPVHSRVHLPHGIVAEKTRTTLDIFKE